jgi:hypothetical protein
MSWIFYNSSGQRLSTAATSISVLDIDGATDIGEALVAGDLFIVDNGANGTNRKIAASGIKTYVGAAPAQAVKSAIVAETNQDTYVPPDLMKHHPGVAKIWASWSFSGGGTPTIIVSRNYTSIVAGGGAGDADHLWATDFSGSTAYTLIGTGGGTRVCCPQNGTLAAGGVTTITTGVGGSAENSSDNFLAGFGNQ